MSMGGFSHDPLNEIQLFKCLTSSPHVLEPLAATPGADLSFPFVDQG